MRTTLSSPNRTLEYPSRARPRMVCVRDEDAREARDAGREFGVAYRMTVSLLVAEPPPLVSDPAFDGKE